MTSDSSQVVDGERPAESKETKREIKRRLKSIMKRFPDRFSDEQVDEIRGRVARSITLGSNLTRVDLPNGTGPDFDPRAMSNG
jgi:hypothetical protein